MEHGEGASAEENGRFAFEKRLPENCAEYMLFVIGDANNSNSQSEQPPARTLASLEAVRKAALELANRLTKDYIWQREAFNLQIKSQQGLVYLHGLTEYGDNVEDEWLIVYLLREVSRSFANLWVRVFDSDGEFLLVEAAKVVPKWLNPEIDAHRVWIHNGHLRIIPLAADQQHGGSGRQPQPQLQSQSQSITLAEAVRIIKSAPHSLIESPFIEAEAFYRLEKYPAQIEGSIHQALATIPRKLAYILHDRPRAIAPAVEAFYLRDPPSVKRLLSSTIQDLQFPPVDLVTVSVRFTKVLFAQLKCQSFAPPPVWAGLLEPDAPAEGQTASKKHSMLELGMKITCGFEIMASGAETSNNRIVREVGLILEDLREDGDQAPLPTDEEINLWPDVSREDDETWMDIDYGDFVKELGGGGGAALGETEPAPPGPGSGFGDATTQTDLRKIVSRFEAFLNDEVAGIEGAELGAMDEDDDDDGGDEDEWEDEGGGEGSEGEDKEVSFDEEEFARMMREMMGLPAGAVSSKSKKGKAVAALRGPAQHEAESEGDGEDGGEELEQIKRLEAQFEAELRQQGALGVGSGGASQQKRPATLATRETKGGPPTGLVTQNPVTDTDEESGEEGEVDLDYNLAKNLLESFKGQAGMAGPAGNILGMMGIALPRDEDDLSSEARVHQPISKGGESAGPRGSR